MLSRIVGVFQSRKRDKKLLGKNQGWKVKCRMERREIILPYFDTIRIHGGKAEVTVEQSERSSLSWRGWWKKGWPLEYQCIDGVLDIKVLAAPGSRSPIKLSINSPSICCLRLDGSSIIQTKYALVTENFEVHHSGDGELVLSINVNRIVTNCQGLGRLSLLGKTNYWRDTSGVMAQVNALGLFVTVA